MCKPTRGILDFAGGVLRKAYGAGMLPDGPRRPFFVSLGNRRGDLVGRSALHPGGVYTRHVVNVCRTGLNCRVHIRCLRVSRRVEQLIGRAATWRAIDVIAYYRIRRATGRIPIQGYLM